MSKLIKDGELIPNRWTILREASGPEVLKALLGKNLIVPLKFWKSYQTEIGNFAGNVAIWLNSNESVADIASQLHSLPLIALNYPLFSDGRSYSNARALRQQYEYKGEVRAIGDVLRDQLFYMSRCGFNSFDLRPDQDETLCLQAFRDFKTSYAATITEPLPLFQRR